jgi:hypothetical protein
VIVKRPNGSEGNQWEGLAEIGLILALIALVVIVALLFFGEPIRTQFVPVGKSVWAGRS